MNITRRTHRHWAVGSAIVLSLSCATIGYGEEYYIYKESDGTKWFTDHKLGGEQYKLVGTYGRPTATKACRGVTQRIMENRARYVMPLITEYAELYELDALLIKAVVTVESCFDTHAVSRVGAKGLMQLMPATAESVGVYNVFNARQNISGGTRYFSKMLKRYQNDHSLALAAYNAGPQAVDKYAGIPPYKETQGYVKKVLKYYTKYQAKARRDKQPFEVDEPAETASSSEALSQD